MTVIRHISIILAPHASAAKRGFDNACTRIILQSVHVVGGVAFTTLCAKAHRHVLMDSLNDPALRV